MSYRIQEHTKPRLKGKFSIPLFRGKISAEADFSTMLTDTTGGATGIAKRLCKLCNAHGISLSQISRLVPEICYTDTTSMDALLNALTPQVVDSIAKTFGISSDWLDGTSESIYQPMFCYESPSLLFDFITENRDTLAPHYPLRLLATKGAFDRKRSSHELALVAVHQKELTPDSTFQWYTPFGDSWIWSHTKARLRLKALARELWISKHRISIPIVEAKLGMVEAVREGNMVPQEALNAPRRREHLEDYALTAEESRIARDTDETQAVINMAKTYLDFL